MRKKLVRVCAALATLVSANCFAEDLVTYVNHCKTQLGFTTLPAMNCLNGQRFAFPWQGDTAIEDWVVYARVNESVDMTGACRWLHPEQPTPRAAAIEINVHNRDTGKTCFFSAKGFEFPGFGIHTSDPQMVSPTAPGAANYWKRPDEIANTQIECVGCHVNGPYIASARIAPFLERLGLLNNGHDTYLDSTSTRNYRAVAPTGGAFSNWDNQVRQYAEANDCSSGCHVIGFYSPATDIILFRSTLLPSIHTVINQIVGEMAPWDDVSAYRWINRDNPFKSGDPGDVERFGYAKAEYGMLLSNCIKPRELRAHAANDDHYLNTSSTAPDKLAYFNARDGLKCVAADQADGQCNNYSTSYRCNGVWTPEQNHAPTATGDDESRSLQSGICANPTAIVAYTPSGRGIMTLNGPKDRLAQFDAEGLECRNADQGAGQSCSNYVVKFADCDPMATAPTYNLVSSMSSRDLTATSSANGAETRAQPDNNGWPTQDWVVEYVASKRYVRLRNIGSGKYLSVQNTSENATVITSTFSETSTNMQWISEPVASSNDVRFKNVASGRYLTVVDGGNFSPVRSQTLNTGWSSQRWRILKQAF
jgi:hypothetical protein